MDAGELVALLTMETLPVAAPVTEGSKLTINVAIFPGVSDEGTEIPLAANPLPVTLTCEMLTEVLPVFVKVTALELLAVPTRILPKFKLLALAESCNVCAVPAPLSAIFALGVFAALLRTVTLPVALPAVSGEKETASDAL
jgi:hypothetical protein